MLSGSRTRWKWGLIRSADTPVRRCSDRNGYMISGRSDAYLLRLLNQPRFVEWIGVPQSTGLIELSGRLWVNKLSRDQAVTAAVHLQRDVGLMQTNVDVLDQYALSLQKAASRIIDNCLGPCVYPAVEIATGALGPRVRRASIQMEG